MGEAHTKVPWRAIPEGRGGTFAFRKPGLEQDDDALETVHHIGTKGLMTCVGVYCSLPDGRCFAAHMFATIFDPISRKCILGLPEQYGEQLKQRVLKQLNDHATTHGWDPHDDSVRNSLLITCPMLTDLFDSKVKSTGPFVIEAIRAFFDRADAAVEKAGGFIVDRESGRVDLIHARVGGAGHQPPWHTRYRMVAETGGEDWYFETVLEVTDRND